MSKPPGRRAAAKSTRRWARVGEGVVGQAGAGGSDLEDGPVTDHPSGDLGDASEFEPAHRPVADGLTSAESSTSEPEPVVRRWRPAGLPTGASRATLRLLNLLHVGLVVAGLAALAVANLHAAGLWSPSWAPSWLGEAGAIAVATTYVWILAARTGGRAQIFVPLTLAVGLVTIWLDSGMLRTGAAVMTAAAGAALGVVVTVPAVRFIGVVREVLIALGVAAVAAVAAIGFEPRIAVDRFDYATLAVSLGLVLALVYRLGAGLHGLGTRGLVVVIVGGVSLAIALAYGELLSRYGTPGLVDAARNAGVWMDAHLGAVPRPLSALLGIPALAWGCHQRARRRQGWWTCAFGVIATASVGHLLVDPRISLTRAGLSELYTIIVGLVLGLAVVRLDLALTGSRGRGGRRAEEATALRPEPARTEALF